MTLASADTITLDPSAVAADRTALELSGAYSITAADYGNAEVEQFMARQQFGEVPVGHTIPNRAVSYTLNIRDDGVTGVGDAVKKLQQKVARYQSEGGWLGRTLNPLTAGEWGADVLYADIVGASLRLPSDWISQRREVVIGVELVLICKPDFYGDEAAGLASTASSGDHDSLVFTEADIPGDYSARSRYEFTDTGSQARQAILIASQSRTYDAAATAALTYEAEDLTPLDQAAVATWTGAHGGASNNVVQHAGVNSQWVGVVSTEISGVGHMTHRGSYRVYARVFPWATELEMRLEWGVGDSTGRVLNKVATVRGGVPTHFVVVDLGEIHVPMDSDQWVGFITGRFLSGGSQYITIDKLWIAPEESMAIVRPRTTGLPLPATYAARDDFSQAAGALNGKTLPVGGTWATSGATTDFSVHADDYLTRATSSEFTVGSGRFAIAGTSTYSEVAAAVDVTWAADVNFRGLVLRYVDSSNWAVLASGYQATGAVLRVFLNLSGTVTTVATSFVSSAPVEGATGRLAATVGVDGVLKAWLGVNDHLEENPGLIYYNDEFVTGGALDSGKVGIYDQAADVGGGTRVYDNFAAWVPDTDAACLADGVMESRHDGAKRETSDSGVYAPCHVGGAYSRAPASGLEARTCRTLVLPSAGDFDTLPDLDPQAFSFRSFHRPTFLFAPEE